MRSSRTEGEDRSGTLREGSFVPGNNVLVLRRDALVTRLQVARELDATRGRRWRLIMKCGPEDLELVRAELAAYS